MQLKGSIVAIITPMNEDGSVDKQALHHLVEWHIASKTQAIVVAGTTGESATLDAEEQYELISAVVKQIAGRIPVIAGSGSNSTRTTIKLTQNAKKAGADACLIVTPYYNKPTQKGLYQHYKTIAENVNIPIILYNVPSRTACDLLPETVEQLSHIQNIIGIKEASGKIERVAEIQKCCDNTFAIFSGDDGNAMEFMLKGAQGVISVTSNVAPVKMQQMCEAALSGDRKSAEKINTELALLHERLFLQTNPIPTKWALHAMGKAPLGIRLPLLPLENQYHEPLREALKKAEALS